MNKKIKNVINNFKIITKYYEYLVAKTKNHEYVNVINEWIIDNYFLVVEHKNLVLPIRRNIIHQLRGSEKILDVLVDIVEENNYNISFNQLVTDLNKYQNENNYYFKHIDLQLVKPLLSIIYIDKLADVCKAECKKINDKCLVEKIIRNSKNKDLNVSNFFGDPADLENNKNYIFEINSQLSILGVKSNQIFKKIHEHLENKNISIKKVINEEYQNRINSSILVTNIFSDLKEFFEFTQDDINQKVSKIEKKLMQDSTYPKMPKETRQMYKERLLFLAKKSKVNEVKFTDDLFKQAERENKNIGEYLLKNKRNNIRFFIYILSVFLTSIVLTLVLTNYFISSRFIGFLILIIPVYQLVIQLVNHLCLNFLSTKPLPKMDFSKGLPSSESTMVVIPTIVSNTDKIKNMFDTLETFYLVNRTNNLYFTLLGDVKAEKKEVMPYDKEICEYGIEYAIMLNKKYKKEIFHFVYRKRLYNEKESCFLGYERKRGALLHFNRLLLKKMNSKDQNKYINVHTFKDFNVKIKYVITLDTDTKLVLNTALDLVGTMAHPLNKPVLNKAETKVIKGYGILQPRVNVDVESSSKSLYSQIFAGIGGFDTYNSIVPNIGQDLFGEGSFVGKGIYDLEVFDKLLFDKFSDNLILSHDLLEGNYIRCGFLSDVELIDDFPSKFLTDAGRQHRWARGDTQVIGWLFGKVRNKNNEKVKNPISLLGKWKIFDNIARMFLFPSFLLIEVLAFIDGKISPVYWAAFLFLIISLPVLFYLRTRKYKTNSKIKTVCNKGLLYGGKSVVLRTLVVLTTIPFYAQLYMNAFFKSLYRMFISKKNLLNWITTEEAEKTTKSDLISYIKNFRFNVILAFIFLLVFIIGSHNYLILFYSIICLIAPFVLWFLSKDINNEKVLLKNEKISDIKEIALKTWKYFEDNLIEENNYLIPDNYQENREEKYDRRTSPTNIGFSLISIVSAYKLKFVSRDYAINTISKVIEAIKKLEKWNGHLFNWYNIKSATKLYPHFISTVDSGNFVASLIILNQFLIEENEEELSKEVSKLIENTNFKRLYTKKDVFSIGFDLSEAKLSAYNYNKFASESRLTSYVAISKGDVPSKHWFCLDKSLTEYKRNKGLISWSGTSFEYYMPLIFMKNYENTLLDESYKFAYICQKKYMESVSKKLPWGISESAYAELDNSLNYKYKTFATPYLKAKEDKENRIVLSPYASILAIELYPEEVYENIIKYRKMDMINEYGFYEAYDHDNQARVKSYFAHHQGMILTSITNFLEKDSIKEYFHKDVYMKTFNILMKEKLQVKTSIDVKLAKYKKYNYEKEIIENDIRNFNNILDMPEVSVLSNKKYCLLMNDRGNSFSRYRTLQLNRYRKITEQDYGMFVYIKDVDNNKMWSNTYAPLNIKPDVYDVTFASDKIKFSRVDNHITTKTEIIVTKDHHAEIRKITFSNNTDQDKTLELTTYTEPILSENSSDVVHRTFNNMFLGSEYDLDSNSLIVKRKDKEESNVHSYMINRLVIDNPLGEFEFETERDNFIGRNRTTSNPIALETNLTNTIGTNLEPIMSLRNKIIVPANQTKSVYFICGFGRSKEQLFDIINSYNDEKTIEKAFNIASLMSVTSIKHLNIKGDDMRLYNMMLNYLYQTTNIAINEERRELLKENTLGQNNLWKFGISGDIPIIVINIHDILDLSFVKDILKAFEYYKSISIFVDIVIINSENDEYASIIKKEVDDELFRIYTLNDYAKTPGSVKIINLDNLNDEEKILFKVIPRLNFDTNDHSSLKDCIFNLQSINLIKKEKGIENLDNIVENYNKKELDFFNEYGGFKNEGKEYKIINKDTPKPWINVLANKEFGTIVTNNGCGFTYCYNSGEYKITSWTNDTVVNDKSEGFKINNQLFDPSTCTHGFGYSVFESNTDKVDRKITQFVPVNDNVKVFLMELTNKTESKQNLNINFWINPILGDFEEKTSRHIYSEFNEENNYIKLKNMYSINYKNVQIFMSSSEKIASGNVSDVLTKSLDTFTTLKPNETKEIVFTLGCSDDENTLVALAEKYNNTKAAKEQLDLVIAYWDEKLTKISVETPDKSFDYALNGWYLYQTLSSRIMAKAGFYQVSGAFGYRDQLQDSMNIVYINPEITRNQILTNAKHQFPEGDVLHWWHEKNKFGLRSRYKDDYLWLVYATIEYINATNDFSILDKKIPFVEGEVLRDYEHERGMTFTYSSEAKSLFEHCLLSLNLAINSMGTHGIPLMGGGDWNDGMNKVGIKGTGESVWLGFFLYQIIDNFTSLIRKTNKKMPFKEYIMFNSKLKQSLNENTWDGEYYLRAFFDNGNKLGSKDNNECKIDLISQSFAIISNVAEKEKVESAINSVEKYLVDKEAKIIKLLTPAFSNSKDNPGYIMNYPKGIRENGGQYTHASSWYIMALIKAGYKDRAYEYYSMINPINRTINKTEVNKYKVEPYVIAADIYSAEKLEGRGGWTWYTGSAGWFYKVGIKDILGFNKEGNKLFIKPNVPDSWKKFSIKYKYESTLYQIDVIKSNDKKIVFDDIILDLDYITLEDDKKTHNIKIYI